ncbi:MAG: PD-(D/E)XK nuclease family protein [Pyrinomonadaceae bacterium]
MTEPTSKYPHTLRRFGYTDILGWSYSRYSTFQNCKRQYYFEKYSKYDIENILKIDHLKTLTSVPMEIGNISHKLIKCLLERLKKSSEEIDREKFADYSLREAQAIFREKTFEDIYYQRKDAVDFESEIFEPVQLAMENFLASDRLRWIFEEALVTKDEWVIEPGGYGECRIDDLKAYCKVDFMFPIGDDLHIIDWKTGKEDTRKHRVQLRGYAIWANFHYKKAFENIETTICHLLPEYRENSERINEYDFEDFSSMIRDQTAEMQQYCAEPELNTPLPKDEFAMTSHENFCKTCRFRELCDRG